MSQVRARALAIVALATIVLWAAEYEHRQRVKLRLQSS